MTPADVLLPRLDAVRETRPGSWLARCPAHDDKHPSLAITERDDGALLICCRAHCDSAAVLAAIGLELADLFPRPTDHRRRPVTARDRFNPRDLLLLLEREATIVVVAAGQMVREGYLADDDVVRVVEAQQRIVGIVGLIR